MTSSLPFLPFNFLIDIKSFSRTWSVSQSAVISMAGKLQQHKCYGCPHDVIPPPRVPLRHMHAYPGSSGASSAIDQLAALISKSKRIVVVAGAGISVVSAL